MESHPTKLHSDPKIVLRNSYPYADTYLNTHINPNSDTNTMNPYCPTCGQSVPDSLVSKIIDAVLEPATPSGGGNQTNEEAWQEINALCRPETEYAPSGGGEQELLWDDKYVDERLGRDASWPQIIEAANHSIRAAATPATVSEQIEYSDAESVKPVQDFKDAIEKATDPFRDKMNTIKVGDIVTVNFNGSQLTLCFEAEVLYVPCASGDSWHFLDKHSGDIHYVSEGCTVTKRSTPTP